MPAEFAPHERTLIAWPARHSLYGDLMGAAEDAHAQVARAIADYELVTMIVDPGPAVARAAELCGPRVDIVELPIDDSWFRDSGPIYVVDGTDRDGGARVALDFQFNGWGQKYAPWDRDDLVASRWAAHAGHASRRIGMVLEGGSICVDGEGTLLTTTQCLMHPNRNPGLTRTEIEQRLCAELGVSMVLWLPYGLADDDDTDGHVDNVAAFARPGSVVVQGCDDPAEPDWLRMDVNARWLAGSLDAAGRPIEVVSIPVLPFAEVGGRRVPVPYVNYYLGNGFVLVPTCGHPADADMLAIIAAQYPGRETVSLDVGAILAYGGGGIHCITQQLPAP
ncbi:MAG TPA: agmatine deiminase family protein [Ilumatobacteraceae bacterium]|nr:agmatine deiminase family protein [Ilumatobacteraceae bacterium]